MIHTQHGLSWWLWHLRLLEKYGNNFEFDQFLKTLNNEQSRVFNTILNIGKNKMIESCMKDPS